MHHQLKGAQRGAVISHLTIPRIAFAGQFQADVSTVNNDVRHYDNASFESRFQKLQDKSVLNGWWNPEGTGAFRLIGVTVNQALAGPSPVVQGSVPADAAVGLFVTAQAQESSAKMVDLDPQFQMGSALFGLQIVLTDGTTEFMRGKFRWAPFRDIYFGRLAGAAGSGSATAKFTSILTEVTWSDTAVTSSALLALKSESETNGDRLSINLMTYNYSGGSTLGGVTGSIGAYRTGDPETFVSARRMAVAHGGMGTAAGIGFFDAEVDGDALSLDLSNALPLTTGSALGPRNIGPLVVAIIRTPDSGGTSPDDDVTAGVVEGQTVTGEQLVLLDEVPYLAPGWLQATAGIVDCALDQEAQDWIVDHPIALVLPQKDGTFRVAIRETLGGLFVRADQFEFRMDPPTSGVASDTARVRVMQWGRPALGWSVGFALQPRSSGQGGSGVAHEVDPPTAPIPDINVPADRVTFAQTLQTDQSGWVANVISASDPQNPRGYLDGQIYTIAYGLTIPNASPLAPVDLIVLHVRDAYEAPAIPDWETDLAPFMKQYGNLYPIMSQWLFSLSDPAVVQQHATLLTFAFERDIDDPNHMPATRDLSDGKRRAILDWLVQFTGRAPAPSEGTPAVEPARTVPGALAADKQPAIPLQRVPDRVIRQMLEQVGTGSDGKTHAMRDYLKTQLSPTGDEK